MSRASSLAPSYDWIFCDKLARQSHPGEVPMVIAARRCAWRCVLAALSIQGVPMLLLAGTSSTFVITHSVEKLFEQGIALKDMTTFCGTSSGGTHFDQFCLTAHLMVIGVCFITAGKAVSRLTVTPAERPHAPDVGIVIAVPLFLSQVVPWAHRLHGCGDQSPQQGPFRNVTLTESFGVQKPRFRRLSSTKSPLIQREPCVLYTCARTVSSWEPSVLRMQTSQGTTLLKQKQ